MTTLYIDREGTELQITAGVLQISMGDQNSVRRLPLKYLDRVVLRSETRISSRLLCALAEHGVNVIALGGRGGQQIAQMAGVPHNDARRRWQQVLTLSQPQACAQLAQHIVRTKIRRQRATISHISAERPDLRKPMHDGQLRLEQILRTLENDTPESGIFTLDKLRGLEGAAAAHYFAAFFSAFAPSLGATGRNRRPPRDPVNATLSISYTMLYTQATAACWSAGLDPALGALHTLSHGRAALACDIMEPFRPAVDLWVWQLFRNGELRREHFGHDGAGACLLGKAGRSHFYPAWERQQADLQRKLNRYARGMGSAMVQEAVPLAWAHLE